MFKNVKKRLKDQRGLTLVELLAVVVILGIIAAIAIPSIGGIIQKSKEDAVKADAIQMLNSAKMYIAANGVADSGGATTITKEQVLEYVDNPGSFKDVDFNVIYDGSTYKLSTLNGDKIKAGNVEIEFDGADVQGIDGDDGKGNRTIPASSASGGGN